MERVPMYATAFTAREVDATLQALRSSKPDGWKVVEDKLEWLRSGIRLLDSGEETELTSIVTLQDESPADFAPECSTCGKPATHLYATWDVSDKTIGSVNGLGEWSPTCDDCDDEDLVEPMEGCFRISGPLALWDRVKR